MYKVLTILFVILLAGCGAAGRTAALTAGASDTVAVWSRSGGLAGRDDRMTVYADGRVQVEGNGATSTVQGDAAAIEALRQRVTGSEWQSLDESYGEQFPDAFAYTIEAGGKTVRTYDGAKMPAALEDVFQQANSLYDAASQIRGP